jgi:flagellar biosynthesis/type III secretory pathway protein FliH
MRTIVIFAVGACIVGTVFFVSLIELIFTIKRRRVHAELEARIKELKGTYNESVNTLVIEGEEKVEATEKAKEALEVELTGSKQEIESKYQAEIAKLTEESEKELASAKARAKKLEQEAKLKAEEYLASRQKEVEHDLMDLVISVTKKVLPASLPYEIQKELVLEALRDVKHDSHTEA